MTPQYRLLSATKFYRTLSDAGLATEAIGTPPPGTAVILIQSEALLWMAIAPANVPVLHTVYAQIPLDQVSSVIQSLQPLPDRLTKNE